VEAGVSVGGEAGDVFGEAISISADSEIMEGAGAGEAASPSVAGVVRSLTVEAPRVPRPRPRPRPRGAAFGGIVDLLSFYSCAVSV
jgi:hypothetical protein